MAAAAGVGDIITVLARVLECNQQALGVDDRYPWKLSVENCHTPSPNVNCNKNHMFKELS